MFGQHTQNYGQNICGLYYNVPSLGHLQKSYLPQVEAKVHATILATTSRTRLQQTFQNPSTTRAIRQVRYAFPLYDGVSVVGFQCHVGSRLIVGQVKAKELAKQVYKEAVERGETAGLLEKLPEASDVFTTTIGNIPPGAKVTVDITYLGELKHDMEVDGIRYTIPTRICPRYGIINSSAPQLNGTIDITVDAEMAEGSFIQRLQSPSHPISMSMGTTSANPNATPSMSRASAVLTLGVAHLETDFVLQVIAKDTGVPKAILETHPTIPNQRALMATLVPKFALPPERPEIVFVCDQSGSMAGSSMALAKEALQVFLKSLPLGVKFNICSFGNYHSFLFPRSVSYSQDTLETANRHATGLSANYGGTEMLEPLRATIQNRYKDLPLDIILLTDGEIWEQQQLFDYLNAQIQDTKEPIRVFTLGIGSGVSHSLIEGIAKAGNGFAQSVQEGEKMNTKVVRMLKGALSPHINDYMLEVKYSTEDDFEVVERVADNLKVALDLNHNKPVTKDPPKKISLFDSSITDSVPMTASEASEDPFSHLPTIPAPKILQAPQSIPSLFAFTRTTVYLLLSPSAPQAVPSSVILRGTSVHGPLELEIPVQILPDKGETIHQLAAKKAVSELEQGRGWLACAQTAEGEALKEKFEGRFTDLVEREAGRLGTLFQVAVKWASFVATETTPAGRTEQDRDWEFLEDAQAAELEKERLKTSSSLFGQQAQQQYPSLGRGIGAGAGASLFAATTQPAASVSPFDSASYAHHSLFGAPPAPSQPAAGGLFGSSSAQNTSSPGGLFKPSPGPSGGLFGNLSNQNTPSTGGGLFGVSSGPSQPSTGGLFGATAASPGGLFGNLSAQHARPTGSLFGAPAASSQTPTANPFGSTSAANRSPFAGGAFGSSSAQNTPSNTLMFGAPSAPPQPSASSLFGSSSSASKSPFAGGGFGSSSAQSTPSNAVLFGAPSAPPQPSTRSPFGSTPAAPAFGDSNAKALQDYQMGLMVLRQENPNRLRMAPASGVASAPAFAPSASASHPASNDTITASAFSDADSELQNFDFDSFLHTGADTAQPFTPFGAFDFAPTPPAHSAPAPTSPQDLLRLLIAHQSFTGAFPHALQVLSWLSIAQPEFERALDSLRADADVDVDKEKHETLLTTALVVLYIEKHLAELRGEWELVVEKARAWLQQSGGDGEAWVRAAGGIV